ncbi:hypothetical protein BGZ70_004596, partial [Mortierella alpina]
AKMGQSTAEPSGHAAAAPSNQIDTFAGTASSEGLRSRYLRHQPSSRDIQHSTLTVASILGSAAQSYLSNEVPSCLLVVQSGKKHGHAGIMLATPVAS